MGQQSGVQSECNSIFLTTLLSDDQIIGVKRAKHEPTNDLATEGGSMDKIEFDPADEGMQQPPVTQDLMAAHPEPIIQSKTLDSPSLERSPSASKPDLTEIEPEVKLSGPRLRAWPINAELMRAIIDLTDNWDDPVTMGELIDDANYKWLKAMVTVHEHRLDVDAARSIRTRIESIMSADEGPAKFARDMNSAILGDRTTTLGCFDLYLANMSELSPTMRKLNGACIGAFVSAAEDSIDDRGFLDDSSKRYVKKHIDSTIDMEKGIGNTIHKRFQRFGRLHQIQDTFGDIIFAA